MQQQNFIVFMEEMTKKMAETFKSLHQMCEFQLTNLRKPVNQIKNHSVGPESHLLAMIEKQNLGEQIIRKTSQTENGHIKKSQKNVQKDSQILLSPKKQQKLIQNQNQSQAQDSKQQIKKLKKKQKQEQKQRQKQSKYTDKQKKQQKSSKKLKPISHKPKAPTSSFLLFFKQQQQIIAKNYPNYGVVQLTKVAALCWNNLSAQQKQPYQKLFQVQRKKYQQMMQIYRKQFPQQIKQKEMRKKQKKSKYKHSKQAPSNNKQTGQKGTNNQKQSENHKQKNFTYQTPANQQNHVKIQIMNQFRFAPEKAAEEESYKNNQNIKMEQQISEFDESDAQEDEDVQNSLGDII